MNLSQTKQKQAKQLEKVKP